MTSKSAIGRAFWIFPGLLIGALITSLFLQWGDARPAADLAEGGEGGEGAAEAENAGGAELSQNDIDTRLLLQHALDSGLFAHEGLQRTVRNAVAVQAAGELAEPSEAELTTFYAQSGSRFRYPARFLVQRMIFRGANAIESAEYAHAQLEDGVDFGSVKAQFASPDLLSLPGGLLEAPQLKAFLGEEHTQMVSQMPRGGYTQPLAEAGGYVILGVLDNEPARKPRFETVLEEVKEHYFQHRRDEALELLLQKLRVATNSG